MGTCSRLRTARLIVLALVSTAVAGTLASSALAATATTPYDEIAVDTPDPQNTGRWAERIVMAGDIDDDGVDDFFVAAPSHTIGANNNAGRVYLMSGKTRGLLYRIDAPEPQADAQFGFFISAFGDANGDGELDIAIGTDAQDVGANVNQGKAWVFSGESGGLLYALDNPNPQPDSRFGSRIGSAGDVTGDGRSDVILGASNNDIPAGCAVGTTDLTIPAGCYRNIGQAYIFNGATGAPVRTLNVPVADRPGASCFTGCGSFGIAVQSPGDTNANGVPDQLVGASSLTTALGSAVGRMYVFEGATGALRVRVDPPEPQPGSNFGFQDATPGSPGDVNGDGRADLYANGFTHNGPAGPGQGRAWIFNGITGALIRPLDDPAPTEGGQFGWTVAVTDYNKDGVPDQYVGQSPHHVPQANDNGGSYVMDGRNGQLLRAFELPAVDAPQGTTTPAGPRLGWTLAAAGDLNADGEPDYIAGAPFTDVGANVDQGRAWIFMSNTTVPPISLPGPGPGPGTNPPGAGLSTAKLSLARATINRRDRMLDVLAPITSLASGRAQVQLHAAGRRHRFTAAINSRDGRIRFRRRIPAAQARLGTGILTITYRGDADTRPQTVRLRAANRKAELRLSRPTIANGRLRASGGISARARGVVRVQMEYVSGGQTRTRQFNARISNGRWSLNQALSQTIRDEIAQRS
nr:FG-GAP repeat protein [Solirubrobacterales bacterium]